MGKILSNDTSRWMRKRACYGVFALFLFIAFVSLRYHQHLKTKKLQERPKFHNKQKILYGPAHLNLKDFKHLYLFESDADIRDYIMKKLPTLIGKQEGDGAGQEVALPSALILGAPMCGSDMLESFLTYHPDVVGPRHEVHFFDAESNYNNGLEWYRKQMPEVSPNNVIVERTAAYFPAEVAPARVKQMNQTIRLIVMLCDPLTPVQHAFSESVTKEARIKDSMHTFLSSIQDQDGKIIASSPVVRQGIYVNSLRRWLDVFNKDQILVVEKDHFLTSPAEELQRVEKFLNLQPYFTANMFKFDPKGALHCIKLNAGLHCVDDVEGKFDYELDEDLQEKLHKFYKPYNDELLQLFPEKTK